jgi:hypothetical protein
MRLLLGVARTHPSLSRHLRSKPMKAVSSLPAALAATARDSFFSCLRMRAVRF